LWDQSLRLTEITRKLKTEAGNAAHFVVFDACRNNLKLRKAGSRSLVQSKGFVPAAQEAGMLIAYATAEGELASDLGAGAGPYASVLAEEIMKPGVEAVTMFRRVQVRVRTSIGQEPWLGFSSLGEVHLAGVEPAKTAPPLPSPAVAPPASSEAERAWDRTKDTTSIAVLEAFITRYKDSYYAELAKARVEDIKRTQVAVTVPPKSPAPSSQPIPAPTAVPPKTASPATPARPEPKPAPTPVAIAPLQPPGQYTDGVIKIGVMNDQSSTFADLSGQGSVWSAKKAVQDFCATTKCHNKIDVVFADHQNKPDVGANIARQWLDTDKVDVVVDVPTSSVALAINSTIADKNKVFLVSGAASSDLTGKLCTSNTVHWTYDTWALANGIGSGVVKSGGDTWFFLTADYAFGQLLERDIQAVIQKGGGKSLGGVRHPLLNQDFSSYLLQAQASKAKIIGLANAGGDTINAIKQAAEFGIVAGGQTLAAPFAFLTDVHALGLQAAQGLMLVEAWYWDTSDANRTYAKEFAAANNGKYPTMVHAGVYSSVLHYLKAVHELRSDGDGAAVVAKMKAMPTDDKLFGKGSIRADGRKIHDMYLVQVKKPGESKGAWDYYKIRATIPAAEAFRPIDQGGCPLVK
jgi:branched-chain amino acid transport system substrate-binding protein